MRDEHADSDSSNGKRYQMRHAETERDAFVHPDELHDESQGARPYEITAKNDRVWYTVATPPKQEPPEHS